MATRDQVLAAAYRAGFELAGIAPALPLPEWKHYRAWADSGFAADMAYLTDHRGDKRSDPRHLLPSARSILCVGKLYHTPQPLSIHDHPTESAWISRYAWGEDYHDYVRVGLEQVASDLRNARNEPFESRICVDTAPLLERAYARQAGLGWIGKNGCLIHEPLGSWFFLGELLLSLDLPPSTPPPDRCGSCTRCIDACPTAAIAPNPWRASSGPEWTINAALCLSYLTIEHRGPLPQGTLQATGRQIFGCDICQDVCPWNHRAPLAESDPMNPQQPWMVNPPLAQLAALTEEEFRHHFRATPVWRARYRGFLRNVAVAMGNSGQVNFAGPLRALLTNEDSAVVEAARWALNQIVSCDSRPNLQNE